MSNRNVKLSWSGVASRRKVVATVALALLIGRLLLIPSERLERDAEVRAAYVQYRYCVRIDILCAPSHPCPYPNCMGDFLRRSAEINRRHFLLSVVERRNLLSGWQPNWYPPRAVMRGVVGETRLAQIRLPIIRDLD